MITNKGKDVLTKYLLGQTATYATYISFGCGATPGGTPTGNETAMEFEMVRVPISSRSLSKVGENKFISLAGELPLTEHYKVTEVAVWSDSSNSLSSSNTDSRVLFAFDNAENWQKYKNTDGILENSPIPFINTAIGSEDGTITQEEKIFACNATNATLQTEERINEGQGVRFLDNTIMMRGDCWIDDTSETSDGIRLQAFSADLSNAAPDDEIRIALGLYPVTIGDVDTPDDINLRLRLRFLTETSQLVNGVSQQIAATLDVTIAPEAGEYYHIIRIPKSQFQFTTNFSWTDVTAADITVGVTPVDDAGEENYNQKWYVGIDAVRFENLTTPNPLYAMVGYAISDTIVEKFANTNAYSEFRFGIDTQ